MTKPTRKINAQWVAYIALFAAVILCGLAVFYLNSPPSGKALPQNEGKSQNEGKLQNGAKPPLADLLIHNEPRPLPSLAFMDEAGGARALADYGGQIVVVNFWASWCAPCREEMPSLNRLQSHYRHSRAPVRVLAVSLDYGDPAKPLAFLQRLGVDELVFLHDPKQKAASAVGVFGLPTTLIVNQKSEEVARLIGDTKWDSEAAFQFIDGLLADYEPTFYEPAESNALSNSGMAVNKSATQP